MRSTDRITTRRRAVAAYTAIPSSANGGGGAVTPFQQRMVTLSASLGTWTGSRYMALGEVSNSSATIANVPTVGDGGGVLLSSSANVYMSNVIYQAPKTTPMFVGFRAKVSGTFSGTNSSQFGLRDATVSGDYFLIGYSGAQSNSFFYFQISHSATPTNTVSTVPLDVAVHDFVAYYDGSTTTTLYIDGASAASTSTLTNFPQSPLALYGVCPVANPATVYEAFWAFAAP